MRRSLIREGRATCFCYCTNFRSVILPQNCKYQYYTFWQQHFSVTSCFRSDGGPKSCGMGLSPPSSPPPIWEISIASWLICCGRLPLQWGVIKLGLTNLVTAIFSPKIHLSQPKINIIIVTKPEYLALEFTTPKILFKIWDLRDGTKQQSLY